MKFSVFMARGVVLLTLIGNTGCGGGGGAAIRPATQSVAAPTPVSSTSCLHAANHYADGCSSAPTGGQYLAPTATDSFGGTSWYGYAAQSGQVWTSAHPWPWDQAAIDYAIGPIQSKAASKDPALIVPSAALPCTYSAAGSPALGPQLYCQTTSGGTVVDLEGYDFGPNFGHTGVYLKISATITSITLKNDWFQNSAGTDFNGSTMVDIVGLSSASLDIENSLFDGNYPAYTPTNANMSSMLNDGRSTCPTGAALVKYTAFINAPQRPISANTCNSSWLFQFDYFFGYGLDAYGQHQEILQDSTTGGSTVASVQYSFTAIGQPRFNWGSNPDVYAGAATAGIAIFSASGDYSTTTYTSVGVDHTIIVANPQADHALPSMAYGIWLGYNNFGAIDLNENYFDPTGIDYAFSTYTATSAPAPNWHGNNSVNMLDGSACYGDSVNGKPCGH